MCSKIAVGQVRVIPAFRFEPLADRVFGGLSKRGWWRLMGFEICRGLAGWGGRNFFTGHVSRRLSVPFYSIARVRIGDRLC